VKPGYRIFVVSERTGSIRELYLSRYSVWAALATVLSTSAAAGAAHFYRAEPPRPSRPALTSAPLPPLEAPPRAAAPRAPAPSLPSSGGACAPGMVLVSGQYCPNVLQRCKTLMDPEGSALRGLRCAEYEQPARCLSPQRKSLRFCIDRDEYVAPHEKLPKNLTTFEEAAQSCARLGKRLCTESEWVFACEGEPMRPYSYGFVRDSSACNADRRGLVSRDGDLLDLRVEPGFSARCTSAAGVRDLTGNLEEYVTADGSPKRALKKGAYWQPGANHCRAVQPQQDPSYRGVELGFRCCAEAGG
jgi:formylglycine-generating enzyme